MRAKLVENIEFKRGQSSKRALNVGRDRLMPIIYPNYISLSNPIIGKKISLEEIADKFDDFDGIEWYDVFLLDKTLSAIQMEELLDFQLSKNPDAHDSPEKVAGIVGGITQDAMGGEEFHILYYDPDEWDYYNIDDVKVINMEGELVDPIIYEESI